MFDGTQLGAVLFKTGSHARIANSEGIGLDIYGRIKIDAVEYDPVPRRSRTQDQAYLGACVETNTDSTYDGFECALLQHAAILRTESDGLRQAMRKSQRRAWARRCLQSNHLAGC
jgi:hypothetical protein